MLQPFPDTATIEGGELAVGGLSATELADRFGTPLVAFCEQTLRARARAYRQAAPDALVAYSVKAFPSLAVLRLLAEEGLGADVSTTGELEYAIRAGVDPERIVFHGNNKGDDEIARATAAGIGYLVIDSLDDVERARGRVLVRVTPGIDADTHDAVRTGHHGSKFGLPPDDAVEAIRRARDAGLDVAGLHLHLGSHLRDSLAARMSVDWLAAFSADLRAQLDWLPAVVDLGGGLGIQYVADDRPPAIGEFVGALLERVAHEWELHGLPAPRLILEPGRSVVGPAGVTLYRVGVVKRASEATTYVAIDGGMSDNPRPQLYGARHTVLVAGRADAQPDGYYTVCGKHCESGDVLVDRVALPAPARGDVLAVAGTGAYTLSMASNYNGVLRPAAVLVADGEATLIRRRETLDDLLAVEA
ncbi:MAG: diaminopimelate decarboxylase [Gaiellaceae bacterium]